MAHGRVSYYPMIVTNAYPGGSLRDRKRLAAMKRVQQIAVARFLADGFDQVTVEEIAAAAEVSAMSVYRWFGARRRQRAQQPAAARRLRLVVRHAGRS